jgi:repressor LexA
MTGVSDGRGAMLTRKQHELLVFIDRYLREEGYSPSFEEMKEALGLRSKSGIHRLISALEERGFLRRHHNRARALEVVRMPDLPLTRQRDEVERRALVPVSASMETGSQLRGDDGANGMAGGGFRPNVIQGDFTARSIGARTALEVAAVQIPFYGRTAGGPPIEAITTPGAVVEVPTSLLGNGEHYALEVEGDSMLDAGILDGDIVLVRAVEMAENGQIVVACVDNVGTTVKRIRQRGNSIALEPANRRHETRIFPADRVRVQGRVVGLMRKF